MNSFVLRVSVVLLILLSASLLAWQHWGMNMVMKIDGASSFDIRPMDDRGAGGNSQTLFERQGKQILWQCDIGTKYEWPFCEIAIHIRPLPEGFDFSRYDTFAVKMRMEGGGSRRMRLFMRHYEKGVSNPRDQLSWKQNELQFDLPEDGHEIAIPLKSLNVASWWLTNNQTPVEHAGVQISSVPVIQLSTSGIREERSLSMTIDYLEFRGKRLNKEEIALVIAALWLLSGVVFLVFDFRQIRQALLISHQRQMQLEQVNNLLASENERVESMARRDPLTGVLNRAGIRDLLLENLADTRSFNQTLSLLCCDIDHFKKINDSHGHAVGDEVLVEFAGLLQQCVRQTDYVVRWGGEEFFLFCRNTPLPAATALAEKLCEVVSNHDWPRGLRITMSIGVATLGSEDLRQFLKRADEALYRAKAKGRNRVEIAS